VKQEFVYQLLIVSLIGFSSIYAAEKEGRVEGEVRIENAFFRFEIEGPREFLESTEKGLNPNLHRENFTISLPGGEASLEISLDGQLTMKGNDKQENVVVVKDQRGEIIFNSEKKNKTDDASLDEEEIIKLQPGSSVTSRSLLSNTSSTVTYDRKISLVSEEDGSTLSVNHSVLFASQPVKLATSSCAMEYRSDEDKGKVFLDQSGKEIKIFYDFLTHVQEGRGKKLLNELSISELTGLAVDLHKHGYTEEFGCNHFVYVRRFLEKKVSDSLKQGKSRGVSCWSTEIDWFQEISRWPWQKQEIIEDALKRAIKPVPKVLYGWGCCR